MTTTPEAAGGLASTGVACACGQDACLRVRAHGRPTWMCGPCMRAYAATHDWGTR